MDCTIYEVKTKAPINCSAPLVLHMQKAGFLMTPTQIISDKEVEAVGSDVT